MTHFLLNNCCQKTKANKNGGNCEHYFPLHRRDISQNNTGPNPRCWDKKLFFPPSKNKVESVNLKSESVFFFFKLNKLLWLSIWSVSESTEKKQKIIWQSETTIYALWWFIGNLLLLYLLWLYIYTIEIEIQQTSSTNKILPNL